VSDHLTGEEWRAYAALRFAFQCLEAAADMMSKGAPYRAFDVQRMVTQGRLKLAELPPPAIPVPPAHRPSISTTTTIPTRK
jgi:hypothetical protein